MTFNISQAVQSLGASHVYGSPYSYDDPYGLRARQATYQAASRMFSPPGYPAGQNAYNAGQVAPPAPTVPGPLGIWQPEASARPYEQIGKFGVNLLGPPPGVAPGAPQVGQPLGPTGAEQLQAMADPNNPTNRGFIEGLLGGLGGVFGDTGAQVGGFVGSLFDTPLEAVGNLAGLPLSLMTAMRAGTWDPEVQSAYDQAARENPLNALLLVGQAAKSQWSKDVAEGRITGLWSDFGPATNLVDQLGLGLQAVFGTPSRLIQRALVSGTGSIEAVERAVREGATTYTDDQGVVHSTDEAIKNDHWAQIQMRLARGDFGVVGSQEARDKMVDQLVVEGATLRAASDVEQQGFVTWQGMADIAFSVATDPLTYTPFVLGKALKMAKVAEMTADTKAWRVVPRDLLDDFSDDFVENGLKRDPKLVEPGEVWQRAANGTRETIVNRLEGAPAKGMLEGDFQYGRDVLRDTFNMPKWAQYRDEGLKAVDDLEKWHHTWGPAVKPIVALVDTINNPFRLFGKDRAALLVGKIFNEQGTEAWIRGQGSLDAHARWQRELGAEGENFLTNYNEGVSHAAAFGIRVYHRAGFVADLRRRLMAGDTAVRNIFGKYRPDEVLDKRLSGATPGDFVAGVEEQQVHYRPLYASKGIGKEAEAIEMGRAETVQRLTAMGLPEERAKALVAGKGKDDLALIHGAYYGHAMKRFVKARELALGTGRPIKKGIDYRNLTMLSFNTLTEQEGKTLRAAAEAGDIDAVREALNRYDLLWENLHSDMKDADLIEAVRALVDDNLRKGTLPRELGASDKLTREMKEWVDENEGFGYRAGFRPSDPQKMWNVTEDANGDIIGINPWIDVVGQGSDVPTYSRLELARDMLFHNVRGSRIMRDANVRLTEYATRAWGITEAQSNALFKRFLEGAKDANTTPRGLTPEQVYRIVDTHGLPDDVMERVGKSQAIEALLFAFEGNWRHVGTAQKFTGYTKTALGGQSNWIGVVAEKIYPAVRFTYNPLFQAQELVEPFVLNIMRGVKPGWKPSEWDEDTIKLVDVLIRSSKYAVDDSIERDGVLLLGGDAARNAFGANTRLGKLIRSGTRGGLLDVQNIKRLNYARALRKELGKEFRNSLYQFAPDWAVKAPAHYQTNDWGEIAVRFLTEKARITTNTDLLKPEHFGARTPINLESVAKVFDDIPDEDALRAAVRSGGPDFLDEAKFKDTLVNAGADPEYAVRAYRKVTNERFTPEEFFDSVAEASGSRTVARHARSMWRVRARIEGLSEEDWLHKRMAGLATSMDEQALAGMSDAEKASHLFYAKAVDVGKGRTATFNQAVTQFRNKYAHVADREHFLILDDAGNEVASGRMPKSWVRNVDGSVTNAQFDGKDIDKLLTKARGHTLIHNHPNHNPFSPHDLATASQFGVKEMIVVAPGYSFMLKPPASGWHTPAFVERFGQMPDLATVGLKASDDAYESVRIAMHEDHLSWMDDMLADAEGVPFYANGNLLHGTLLEGVAQQHAIENMAKAYGWQYTSVVDHRIGASATEVFNALEDFRKGVPEHLRAANPQAMKAAPLERNDLRSGQAVQHMAAEYTSQHMPWLPSDDVLRAANPDAPRLIQDYYEDWFRADVASQLGALITDVRRTQGGWLNGNRLSNNVNSVLEMYGPDDTGLDVAAAWGYLTKQDRVDLSRIKPKMNAADAAAGERWAMHFTAPRELDEAEVDEFVKAIAQAAPEVAGWGYKDTLDRSGRTVLRFIRGEQTGVVDRATFDAAAPVNEKVLAKAFGRDEEVLFGSDVVDYRTISNDWSKNPNGEGYTSFLRARRPEFADELESGLAQKSTNVLAHAVRSNAPAAFDSHLDAIRAAGGSVPDFRTPGQWKSAPFASRVGVPVPGGREALLNDPTRVFTLYEQQLLKAAAIDPLQMYEHDPELAVALMKAIWRSKAKELGGTEDLLNQYNAFGWALMTANSQLDSTEGAFALWRAVRPGALGAAPDSAGIAAHVARTKRLLAGLTPEQRANPATRATMFQLDEGLRVSAGLDLHRATWLDDAERERLIPLIQSIDERLSAVPEGPERVALARRIQAEELDPPVKHADESLADYRLRRKERLASNPWLNRGKVSLQAHDFGSKTAGDFTSFTTIARPGVRFKGTATNMSWGRLMGWLDSGLLTSEDSGVQTFLRQQANESRHAYALRLSSILPGIDVKTGLMAVQTAGPGAVAHGALDTHIIRYIMQRAGERGEADNLLAQLSKGYREHLAERLPSTGSGQIDNFKSPTAIQRYLVPDSMRNEPWSEAKRAAMEARLGLIDDEVTRDLYRSPEVLRYVSETGGKINTWEGSDYQILSDYFNTVLRMEEVDALRAKGFHSVAEEVEAMNGGEWQWFKWDHIRAASAGQSMDPHVSVTNGVEAMTPRTSMELDRNIVVSRNKTPYDPINSMVFQEMDGRIMGAVRFDDMDRATLMLTEHADAGTIVHELGHIFEKDLDDSMRQSIMREFRKATGSRQRQWSRAVSEWWADSYMDYARSRGHRGNEGMRSSFAYFRKSMNAAEEALHTGKEREVLEAQKMRRVVNAQKAITKHSLPLKPARDAVTDAAREYNRAARGLKSARSRAQLPALDREHGLAKGLVEQIDQNLRDAKSRVRALAQEQRAAELKAEQALGTPAAGGARRAANRKAQQIAEAEAQVKQMTKDLGAARTKAGEAARKVSGARRRIPVGEWESRSASSKEVLDAALRKQRVLEKNLSDAQDALKDARALKVKPKGYKPAEPVMSDDLRRIWDDLMKEPDRPNLMAGDGQPFDMQEEAVYQAALHALSRAEENAFTLHYYKRGRSLVERSINHPYFGLYPASYMWGKVLPELTRFLLKSPFGLDAPLGGLALSHNIYRQMLTRQQFDPNFRNEMASNTDFWHFVALMTPALPWEVPVNAPLWMRRISEGGLTYQDKLEDIEQRALSGDLKPSEIDPTTGLPIPPPTQDIDRIASVGKEMLSYAFGPANAVENVAGAVKAVVTPVDAAINQVEELVRGGQEQALAAQGVAPQGLPAMIPPQNPAPSGQGY